MLIAGLRPQQSFSKKWVFFNNNQSHTMFRHFGLATGNVKPAIGLALGKRSAQISMAVKLNVAIDNRFQVLAQIDSPKSADPLIIGQWQSHLIIMIGRDYRHEHNLPRLSADLSEYTDSFIDIDIILAPDTTSLKLNQKTIAQGPHMPFSKPPTRISIGNAPDGRHGWSGDLRHFQLQSTLQDRTITRYQFDQNGLPDGSDNVDTTHRLIVPKPGHFPDRAWIGALRMDQLVKHNNIQDVIVNFLGFMPFGFLVCAVIAFRSGRHPRLKTVAMATVFGFVFSLAIESAQTYIAGRSPHAHDLLLNTLGSAAGALSLLLVIKIWCIMFSATKPEVSAKNPE